MAQPSDTAKRRKANRLGYWAELKAAFWLILRGHRILERRYKTSGGEIDIIAKKGNLILIIEVKARNSIQDCIEAVTFTAQRRIHNAADFWLAKQRHGEKLSLRFDIIAIVPGKLPKHFENMF